MLKYIFFIPSHFKNIILENYLSAEETICRKKVENRFPKKKAGLPVDESLVVRPFDQEVSTGSILTRTVRGTSINK